MQETIFFKSAGHRERFITAIQQIERVYEYDGKIDPEYGTTVYVLTADLATWEKVKDYVSHESINIPLLLEQEDFSGGASVLIKWAGSLFNGYTPFNPVDLMRLDESNFQVALSALVMRRHNWSLDSFLEEEAR